MIATLAQRESKRKRTWGAGAAAAAASAASSAVVHPRVYTGVFAGFGVRVDNPQDAADLTRCGHYGKGTLSRGDPQYDRSLLRAVKREQQKEERVAFQRKRNEEIAAANAAAAAAAAAAGGGEEAPAPPAPPAAPLPRVQDFTPERELRPVETLQLSLVEAYFLCSETGVGCLRVLAPDGVTPMEPRECWAAFTEANERFPELYATYHFLRARSWVPRGGLKFGCDFIIYKVGPSTYHADFSVVVASDLSRRAATWTSLQALARTTINVSKDVLVVHVVRSDEALVKSLWGSPEVLEHMRPRFTMVRRWNEKRNR